MEKANLIDYAYNQRAKQVEPVVSRNSSYLHTSISVQLLVFADQYVSSMPLMQFKYNLKKVIDKTVVLFQQLVPPFQSLLNQIEI